MQLSKSASPFVPIVPSLLSLGNTPFSLILTVLFSCLSPPRAPAYSSPDTSWIACLVDNLCSDLRTVQPELGKQQLLPFVNMLADL